MIDKPQHLAVLQSPSRTIYAAVEHFKGSTLYKRYNRADVLKSISVDREGLQKFFGFGVCQSAEITLLDTNREIEVDKGDIFMVLFGIGETSFVNNFAYFYANEITRDENTNELKIKCWDKIAHRLAKLTFDELSITYPATIADYATQIANKVGLTLNYPADNTQFALSYEDVPNYEGTETLREILDDIAEITQTIYYIKTNQLIFKRLANSQADLEIGKADYFKLTSKDAVVLGDICSATELGDNITAESDIDGATQYIKNNGFLDLREDRATILENAVSAISGLTIHPVSCEWRGNYLLEVGDCLAFTTKDDNTVYAFLLNEKIVYNGGFSSTVDWEFAGDAETATNPSTIGEALKQTFAKVDKVNKEITLAVDEIATLQLTTSGITAEMAELDAAVSAAITTENVRLEIKKELAENGIDKVITATGFVFDEAGLTVSKSGTEMTTTITEDGMTVNKNGDEMLKADNVGVKATNLHAKTYLIIGETSRFENYDGNARTGCFWIGG